MNYTGIVGCFVLFLLSFEAFAQCETGNEPSCKCETAEILCSADDLNGYTYSMSEFLHPNDGPNDGNYLCNDYNSELHNPTWFAFTAWCTTMDIEVEVNSCTNIYGYIFGFPFFKGKGMQLGIFDGCGDDANPIACDLICNETNSNTTVEPSRNISMNNLIKGKKYYMVVDGCYGSACNIKINILNDCGPTIVGEWEEEIVGPTDICVGDDINYTMEKLDGANRYHWFINNMEEQVSESTDFSRSFDTPGIYTICADASNDPCINITEMPDKKCKTIQVHAPLASTLEIIGDTNCPNDEIIIKGTSQTDSFFATGIVVANNESIVVLSQYSVDTDFTPSVCGEFKVYEIIVPTDELILPEIGDLFNESIFDMDCLNYEQVDVFHTDTVAPQFVNLPNDTTIYCVQDVPQMQYLAFVDNCLGEGSVMGVEEVMDVSCNYEIERNWSVVDSCGNENTHTQLIKISPKESEFIVYDIPLDTTLSCGEAIPDMHSLSYIHPCDNEKEVSGVERGAFTICDGGQLIRTWTISEPCLRDTTFQQIITIEAKQSAKFDNHTQDTILTCEEYETFNPTVLRFGTNTDDLCAENGIIEGVYSAEVADCDATTSIVWDTVDMCGNRLYHIQNIIIEPEKYIDTNFGAPNIFNPSQGNFTIYANEGIASIDQLTIYDRWGSKVYSQTNFLPNDETLGWNGRYNDDTIVQGVYMYRAIITYQDGSKEIIMGDITVVE